MIDFTNSIKKKIKLMQGQMAVKLQLCITENSICSSFRHFQL